MADNLDTTDKTYTLHNETSNYEEKTGVINVILPQADEVNPYQFTIYDVSQDVNGEHYNGLFVYMKKTYDSGDDLTSMDNDKTACLHNFNFNEIVHLINCQGYSAFDKMDENMQSFVFVYHDTSEIESERRDCAERIYQYVPSLYADLIANGPFTFTMELVAGKPKKIGMSPITRTS